MDIYCGNCGSKMFSGNKFCTKYGFPVNNYQDKEIDYESHLSDWEYTIEDDYSVITKYIGSEKIL